MRGCQHGRILRAGLMETANIINRMKPRAQGEWVNYTRTDRCEGVSSVRTSSEAARELLVLGRHWKVTVRSRFSSQRPTKNREETPRSSFYFFVFFLRATAVILQPPKPPASFAVDVAYSKAKKANRSQHPRGLQMKYY